MRDLNSRELSLVTGGSEPDIPPWEIPTDDTKKKNNNGYGNGPETGPPPGNSGAHNPTLTGWNEGPRGPR